MYYPSLAPGPQTERKQGAGYQVPRRGAGSCGGLAPNPSHRSRSLTLASSVPQYGFVNHALELLVIRNYGPEVWEDIK